VQLNLWKEGGRLAAALRDPAAILRDYRQLSGSDLQNNADYGRRIASPTLLIGGTADQFFDWSADATMVLTPVILNVLKLSFQCT
jgi:hypothetical protein